MRNSAACVCTSVRISSKSPPNNPEQEEAEEILDVSYGGTEMEIGFNVSYVLDVLNALKCETVRIYADGFRIERTD
ncbi:DNA polymerase III subunit beta [Salmonella enterica subsp. enterica]|nr:DNA polymerase III subunit beta [Salmonella enterica subsp. enterica] [Salmonella enterica subsp. enterica serovar Menston]